MSLDLKKMKQKLREVQNNEKGGGGNSKFWRPQDGLQTIRILPTEDGDPFKTFFFHYNVGKAGVLCPKRNFGDDCPICNFATSLYQSRDEDSMKAAKSLFARQRFFSPVVVRGEEDEGVRTWGYGKMAYQSLLELACNPEYGDFTDLQEGTDIDLTYGKVAGQMFPQTKITPKRNTSPVCQNLDDDKCKELLESIPDFDDIFERRSTQDVKQILDEYLAATPEDSSSEVSKYGDGVGGAVQKAFDEVVNN